MNEKMPDIKETAGNPLYLRYIADVFDVMGYDLAKFNFDVLSGVISVTANEKGKTAEAAASAVRIMM